MTTAASISFAGTDPDECAYFFEVRSAAACGGVEPVQQTLGPGGVFGVIALIAVVVYFIGGIMYQRSVAHARGWRQLPNYSLWAGIGSFFQVSLKDLLSGVRRVKGPRVASVRDGVLPTMEHRPTTRGHRSFGSRSTTAYYPP
jgi:cation-dependent mannose-6-phosphate receptor